MPQNELNWLKIRPKMLKICFLRDIFETKLGANSNKPSSQQNIITIDVIIGVEMHIEQYFTSYNHEKRSEMAKLPKKPPFWPIFRQLRSQNLKKAAENP